jgi:hypothetical protein
MATTTQKQLKITGSRKAYFDKTKPKQAKGGLRGTDISLSAYNTAAMKIRWADQKEMYQQGHDFFLNYHNLYADNQNNDIGQFLDLHYSLVQNYAVVFGDKNNGAKGKVSATSEAEYGDLVAKATKKINFLQRNLSAMTAEQQESAGKKIKFLNRIISQTVN